MEGTEMAKNVLFANSAADFNLTVLTHHGMLKIAYDDAECC